MKRFYGDPAVGYWKLEKMVIYPGQLKDNEGGYEWKPAVKMSALWPYKYGQPLHYSEE